MATSQTLRHSNNSADQATHSCATAAEAEGLSLHLNPNAQCGYLGVSINVNSKGPESAFRVIFRTKHIGYFPTAVAGAVAYARCVLEYEQGADAAAAASSSCGR